MAITFNRRPMSINVPNNSDVKQNYFNHFNWKGINQNRNFLAVDQETFADSKNVYIDEEGLLKSRLPIKFKHMFDDKTLKDIQTFDEILICVYVDSNGDWRIGILQNDTWVLSILVIPNYTLKVFRNGEYLYIFSDTKVLRYDAVSQELTDNALYIPVTRRYTGESYLDNQSANVLSDKQKFSYILNSSIWDDNSSQLDVILENKVIEYRESIDNDVVQRMIHGGNINEQVYYNLPFGRQKYVINCYNVCVPTFLIFHTAMYWIENNKLYYMSLSDLVPKVLYTELEFPFEDFVKIKMLSSGQIALIYKRGCRTFWSDGALAGTPYLDSIALFDYDNGYITLKDGAKKFVSAWAGVTEINADGVFLNTSVAAHFPSKSGYDYEITFGNLDSKFDAYKVDHCNVDIRFLANNLAEDNYKKQAGAAMVDMTILKDGASVVDVCDIVSQPDLSGRFYCHHAILAEADTYRLVYNRDSNYLWFYQGQRIDYQVDNSFSTPKFYSGLIGINPQDSYDKTIFYGEIQTSNNKVTFSKTYRPLDEPITVETWTIVKDKLFVVNEYSYLYFVTDKGQLLVITKFPADSKLFTNFVSAETWAGSRGDYWFIANNEFDYLISNYRRSATELYVTENQSSEYYGIDGVYKFNDIFVTKRNKLYIGSIIVDFDDKEKLWFKEVDTHILESDIKGIHTISENEYAVFLADRTYTIKNVDGIRYYYESKIVPTLKNYSKLITLPDSTTTLMPSNNGIIALSYQNFVNTTEQSTINLTADLDLLYQNFKNNVLSLNFKFYTIFYESGNELILIYDNRNSSWWLWELPVEVTKLFIYQESPFLLSNNSIYKFETIENQYYDELNNGISKIDWFIESQKLHFSAHNYYKHISNLTLASAQEGDGTLSLNLNVKNYRKWVNNGKEENFDYKIDVIRTYIKRVNYAKVCEFQYKLSSDDSTINVPLALSSITIKYKIGGQVR